MALNPAILDEPASVLLTQVERGRIRQFATAIGETNPVYHDLDAARSAGHPDLLAPPTFLFGLELEQSEVFDVLARYGVDISQVLHGEQTFEYHGLVHAGDEVRFSTRGVDLYSKAGGALDFLVRRTEVTRSEELVATFSSVTVIKNGSAA
ncbi:MaoC family dehydratase N-terminal domain-containing protein [Nocardia miyunensis]|uniref:MaoC family dehydratase N-terminal domain-containing protein n=1 Tax=Nocardia miyunensis TaxID=282684 RepID=UPI000833EA06|nr:MaoC family dehydratase N-terminal domain-containing protein [Nocardia miyunensis]